MKKIFVLTVVLLVLGVLTSPVGAMIGGTEDTGDEVMYPNVGAIVFRWPANDDIFVRACTATLIRPRALVTAAHCVTPLIDGGVVPDKVWITFEPEALFGDPESNPDEYLEIEDILVHPGSHMSQEYHDIALVILKYPVDDIEVEPLPTEGYLGDELDNKKVGDLRKLQFVVVGYGATAWDEYPDIHLDAVRRYGTTTYHNLLALNILTEKSDANDVVICKGDSGGPVFYVDSDGNEILVGIHSRSTRPDKSCDDIGLSIKYRLDTESALDWIYANLPED